MTKSTGRLQRYLDTFALIEDRSERIQLLIDIADRFCEVPPEVASRPFPRRNLAPHCESEAYVWVVRRPDGTVDLHFAVENPQGISARALAVILQDSLAGETPDRVAAVPSDLPYAVFGNELSMGKTMGLTAMVAMVKSEASRLSSGR
jgi:cysteine desulfuration protein SufE